jgi:processive 1,2-diacylglycerol beta-glucosyltransferase
MMKIKVKKTKINARTNTMTELGINPKRHPKETPMDSCDIFFTKPGGLSSTEGAIKNIPMIHTAPIPGNETNNSSFFSSHGMSYSSKVIRKQLHAAKMIINDPAYREYMVESQKETITIDSCQLIYEALRSMQPQEGDAV